MDCAFPVIFTGYNNLTLTPLPRLDKLKSKSALFFYQGVKHQRRNRLKTVLEQIQIANQTP
jgi:hypothetical protein